MKRKNSLVDIIFHAFQHFILQYANKIQLSFLGEDEKKIPEETLKHMVLPSVLLGTESAQ